MLICCSVTRKGASVDLLLPRLANTSPLTVRFEAIVGSGGKKGVQVHHTTTLDGKFARGRGSNKAESGG